MSGHSQSANDLGIAKKSRSPHGCSNTNPPMSKRKRKGAKKQRAPKRVGGAQRQQGAARGQHYMLDERGYIILTHAARLLGYSPQGLKLWIDQGKLDAVKIGHSIYIRKSAIAVILRNEHRKLAGRDAKLDHIHWLLGDEVTGECETCARPIPLSKTRCALCLRLEV